jgi:hypothetical protein
MDGWSCLEEGPNGKPPNQSKGPRERLEGGGLKVWPFIEDKSISNPYVILP